MKTLEKLKEYWSSDFNLGQGNYSIKSNGKNMDLVMTVGYIKKILMEILFRNTGKQ